MHLPRKKDGRVDWIKARDMLLDTYRQELTAGNLTQAEYDQAVADVDIAIDTMRKKYHYDLWLERHDHEKKQ